ncbi:MAG: superoxide dismutase family protein [Verrucomicrobiales bacterium]|nr:superoxide dismutase family protein [Verrucomicrobiales bacterium]
MKNIILTTILSTGLALSATAEDSLVSVINPTGGNITKGVVTFEQVGTAVSVKAVITGLKPGQKHAIHVHEFGDVTSLDAKSAGGHYNPIGHPHGLTDTTVRHAGDLGNIHADADGVGVLSLTILPEVLPEGGVSNFAGRAVIIHAEADDGGQPTGNAGPRIAAGVIGYGNPDADAFSVLEEFPNRAQYIVMVSEDSNDGAAEKAGENLDKVGEKVADGVEEAARETGKALKKIGKAIEKELNE